MWFLMTFLGSMDNCTDPKQQVNCGVQKETWYRQIFKDKTCAKSVHYNKSV